MNEIARRIRAARHYAGLTLEELAARIETSRDTVFRTENEQRRTVKQSELNAIAEACGVPRAWFSIPFSWLSVAELIQLDLSAVEVPEEVREVRRRLVAEGVPRVYSSFEEGRETARQMDLVGATKVVDRQMTEDGDLILTAIRVRPRREAVHLTVAAEDWEEPDEATKRIDERAAQIIDDVKRGRPSTPPIAARAREAAQRLEDNPDASQGTRRAAGGEDPGR